MVTSLTNLEPGAIYKVETEIFSLNDVLPYGIWLRPKTIFMVLQKIVIGSHGLDDWDGIYGYEILVLTENAPNGLKLMLADTRGWDTSLTRIE